MDVVYLLAIALLCALMIGMTHGCHALGKPN